MKHNTTDGYVRLMKYLLTSERNKRIRYRKKAIPKPVKPVKQNEGANR